MKSESTTQEWTLATVPAGRPVDVVDIGDKEPAVLLVHGLRPGVRVVVDGDAPLGGPRIVRIGAARIAIDRGLARSVRVVAVGPLAAAS